MREMRSEASSDVFKVWLYAAASVLLGAWSAPLLYNAGKALAEVCTTKQINGPLEWLAGICQGADFPRFFLTSLVISAAILFLPFMKCQRGGRTGTGRQGLTGNLLRLRQCVTGFLLVTTLVSVIGGALFLTGIFEWKNPGTALKRLVLPAFGGALGLAILQEILFRGIAMGIFLRAMRPAAALGMAALLFALVHFLNPPPGLTVLDPDSAGVGFELLRKIGMQFSEPRVVLGTLAPLLALGGVLACARLQTASLGLPIGLHAGCIFTHAMLASVTVAASRQDSILWLISGAALIAGVLAKHSTKPADDNHTPT